MVCLGYGELSAMPTVCLVYGVWKCYINSMSRLWGIEVPCSSMFSLQGIRVLCRGMSRQWGIMPTLWLNYEVLKHTYGVYEILHKKSI